MNIRSFIAAIFPYRTHLEAEVEYLRAQLSQRQRRIDELIDAINKVALRPKEVKVPPPAPLPTKPKDWNSFRRINAQKESDETESTTHQGSD